MKQFRLSKQPQPPGAVLTKFHVLDSANSAIGIITVPNEDAADLERHWLGAPQAKAHAALSPSGRANPMISAMVAAHKRQGPPPREAILRGCR